MTSVNNSGFEDKIFFKPSTPTEFQDKKIIEDYEICEYETEMNLEGVSKYTDNIITAKVNGFSYTSLGTSENGKDAHREESFFRGTVHSRH